MHVTYLDLSTRVEKTTLENTYGIFSAPCLVKFPQSLKNSSIFTHIHIINFAAVGMSTQKLEGYKVFNFPLFQI